MSNRQERDPLRLRLAAGLRVSTLVDPILTEMNGVALEDVLWVFKDPTDAIMEFGTELLQDMGFNSSINISDITLGSAEAVCVPIRN